jgi:hypothetical protein
MRERILAFLCLIAIRLYRGGRMIGVLLEGDADKISRAWNRT